MSFTTLCKRFLVLSLALAAFGFTSLHAQTVAYVTKVDGTVSVIDTLTNTVTATIPVGAGPFGVVFSPDSRRAYVTNAFDGTVSVIDTATSTVVDTIVLTVPGPVSPSTAKTIPFLTLFSRAGISPKPAASPALPFFPAITPDGKHLYVPDAADNAIFIVDTATDTAGDPVFPPGANFPASVVITPDGLRAYVLNADGTVFVLDTATNTQLGDPIATNAVIPSAPPLRMVVGSDGRIYLPSTLVSEVDVISGVSLTSIPLPDCGGVLGLSVAPDSSRVYSSCPFPVTGTASVAVFDTNNPPPAATPTYIPLFGPGPGSDNLPYNSAVTPDGAFVYVANGFDTAVYVIDTTTNTQSMFVAVGVPSMNIAIANLSTPFAAFNVTNMVINGQNIHQQAQFTLGEGSTGIDLAHQPLTLTIGTFSITIPAGKFKQVGGNLHFIFNGTADGLKVNFNLQADKKSSTQFSYVVDIHGTNQTMQLNPAAVTLKIGENQGTTSAMWH
jgi:YVTN family beta-propeller protein